VIQRSEPVQFEVTPVPAEETLALRDLYRQEMNCQIVLDSWHGRGWANSYLFRLEGRVIGYGLVGGVKANPREIITEFYVLAKHRGLALPLFRQFAATSQARSVEAQSNDILLTLMLYDCADKIESNVILFHDALTTSLSLPGVTLRKVIETDREQIVNQKLDPDAEWLLEADGVITATGGLLFHYNVPYGDIYMGVAETLRRCGYGSYLIQELKRVCYEMGRRPAARCNVSNAASRASLQKAGMWPCARVLFGTLSNRASQPAAG
jgi:GNAT superfamily N-acetyltransferase